MRACFQEPWPIFPCAQPHTAVHRPRVPDGTVSWFLNVRLVFVEVIEQLLVNVTDFAHTVNRDKPVSLAIVVDDRLCLLLVDIKATPYRSRFVIFALIQFSPAMGALRLG